MKSLYSLIFCILFTVGAWAQPANVQIIHNAPSNPVDIYADGVILLRNVEFRTATEYLELPSNTLITLSIANSPSSSVADAPYSRVVRFDPDANYILMAQGVLGEPNNPLFLNVKTEARTTSNNAAAVDMIFSHGAVGARAVDGRLRGATANLFDNVFYNQFSDYISLNPGAFYMDLNITATDTLLGTYNVDLSTYAGQSVTVFWSGFDDPSRTPQKGLYGALSDGTIVEFPYREVATWQLINNTVGNPIDIYLNGALALNDFVFQGASNTILGFVDTPVELGIAPSTSASIADAYHTQTISFTNNRQHALFLEGIAGDMTTPPIIHVASDGKLFPTDPATLDLIVHHGVTDAPNVDLSARGVGTLITDLGYGGSEVITVPPATFILDITPTGGMDPVSTHLAGLVGAQGGTYTVYASGLLNNTGAADELQLVIVTQAGQSFYLTKLGDANVQVLHNSPSELVDVYISGNLAVENVDFRNATPQFTLLGPLQYEIAVVPAGMGIADSIRSINIIPERDMNYLLMAEGIPGDASNPFDINIVENYRFASLNPSNVDVIGIHGSPGAPTVDILANGGSFISGLSYGQQTNYFNLSEGEYDLSVTPAGMNSNVLATYQADLNGLAGQAVSVFASGILNGDPAFHLWALLADGTTFPLPLVSSTVENLDGNINLRVGPNPATDYGMLHFSDDFSLESIDLLNEMGQMVKTISKNEMTESSNAYKFDLSDVKSGQYALIINGENKSYSSKLLVVK